MFEYTSRYYNLEQKKFKDSGGRVISYAKRRFLPQGKEIPVLGEIAIAEGDRLDLITYRTLGDPEQFWQICDANNAMNPVELIEEPGSSLVIPLPQA